MHNRRAKQKLTLALDESGATAIIIALIFSVLCGFVALAVDVGHMVVVKAELQRAADAGALSGVLGLVPYTGSYPILTPDWLTDGLLPPTRSMILTIKLITSNLVLRVATFYPDTGC